jgi:hypothetical protein
MRVLLAFHGVLLLAAACSPSPSAGPQPAPPSNAPVGCDFKSDPRVTLAGCFADHFVVGLPGEQYGFSWSFEKGEAGAPAVLLQGHSGEFRFSVLAGPPDRHSMEEHLASIRDRAGTAMPLGPGRALRTPKNNRAAILYEVQLAAEKGARSVHAWTSLPRQDDSILDYHVSWTGAAEAAGAARAKQSDQVEHALLGFLDAFFVVGPNGERLPEPGR